MTQNIKIKQATKRGYIDLELGGVADLSYPSSTTRRGRVKDKGRICPTISTMGEVFRVEQVRPHYRIRKLTPRECFRLMSFSTRNDDGSWNDEMFERAEKVCSNTQLYKQIGNSICVEVLCQLFKQMVDPEEKSIDSKRTILDYLESL